MDKILPKDHVDGPDELLEQLKSVYAEAKDAKSNLPQSIHYHHHDQRSLLSLDLSAPVKIWYIDLDLRVVTSGVKKTIAQFLKATLPELKDLDLEKQEDVDKALNQHLVDYHKILLHEKIMMTEGNGSLPPRLSFEAAQKAIEKEIFKPRVSVSTIGMFAPPNKPAEIVVQPAPSPQNSLEKK